MKSIDVVQRQFQLVQQNNGAELKQHSINQKSRMDFNKEQKIICEKYSAPFVDTPAFFKVGIALNVKEELQPINGLRHRAVGDTSGWYIWAGEEFSEDPDFFATSYITLRRMLSGCH